MTPPITDRAHRDHARARVRQLVRGGQPCHLCAEPIDLTLRWPDRMSMVVDHLVPTSRGGSDGIDNLAPAHAACNRARSDGPLGTLGINSGALD